MDTSPLVKLSAVDLVYHTPDGETQALDGVDFEVFSGEFVALVGPSGCGKSTILSLVAGLLEPSSGEVLLAGQKVSGPSPRVGYMLQQDHLFEWRTIYSNAILGLEVQHKLDAESRAYVEGLLHTYDLWQFRNYFPHQLSGGMRQRAALIRTLAARPDLLLLDEAFSALDYQTRLVVSGEIADIIRREGKTALMVSHDIPEAISLSDRVLVFSQRPAHVQTSIPINLPAGPGFALSRRHHAGFNAYFNRIWKELDVHGKQEAADAAV
ncbi:ABC transporter ATP-binding protein [Luoshenia tenuis]|jgi:NitT/TauT family transport system ATP-binding protein|uniref:ABC transporter ATP-binding protein n=1 Tax=Luoshenia tenuis TaxID=2763654 RepID=UPI000822670B|nr:Bicarbonate transport ATP-binding protein CmpC [uncultured Clostridium sp.]